MCKYQSPSLYYSCGCGKKYSKNESNYSYYKDNYRDDVQSYRPSKYNYYSDEKKYDDYYDSYYEQLEGTYSKRRHCNCSYCRHKRRKKEKRFICHCRPY